jgi:CBS domain-containing membrane protein
MDFSRFIHFNLIPIDPVNLGVKGKLLSVASCFGVIFVIAWITQLFTISTAYPILVASVEASAIILFLLVNSPGVLNVHIKFQLSLVWIKSLQFP